MIVLDAGVLAFAVGDDGAHGDRVRLRIEEDDEWAVPDLVYPETVAVLRKRWVSRGLAAKRFRAAVESLVDLPLFVHPCGPLMLRAFALRENITAHDACYVALAEGLRCPLLTMDERLARAPGLSCGIEVMK